MADLKLPELNCVTIAGNLTNDPVFRMTARGTPVINFTIAVTARTNGRKKYVTFLLSRGIRKS